MLSCVVDGKNPGSNDVQRPAASVRFGFFSCSNKGSVAGQEARPWEEVAFACRFFLCTPVTSDTSCNGSTNSRRAVHGPSDAESSGSGKQRTILPNISMGGMASSGKFYLKLPMGGVSIDSTARYSHALNGGAPAILVLCLPVACKPQSPVEGYHRRRSRTSSFDTGVKRADDVGEGKVSSPSISGAAERQYHERKTGINTSRQTEMSYAAFFVLGRTGI